MVGFIVGGNGGEGVILPRLTNPAAAGDILAGKEAINKDNEKISGTIVSKGGQVYYPSTSWQYIDAGQYLSGSQAIASPGEPWRQRYENDIDLSNSGDIQTYTISGFNFKPTRFYMIFNGVNNNFNTFTGSRVLALAFTKLTGADVHSAIIVGNGSWGISNEFVSGTVTLNDGSVGIELNKTGSDWYFANVGFRVICIK